MSLVYKARIALIRIGKILPFIICAIVCLSYIEGLYSLNTERFILYDSTYILYKPISRFIAYRFEYDLLVVVILLTLSVSVETCIWNKMAILYLAIHLGFKRYAEDIELDIPTVAIYSIANIVITAFIVYKGIKRMVNV